MSLLLVTSAGCDAGAVTDCSSSTFVVTTTQDINDGQCTAGHCSLREAIIAANSCTPPFRRSILLGRGTYTLTLRGPGDERGDLNINGLLSISGADTDLTIIQGGDSWNYRIFAVGERGEVSFELLTIQGGNSSADGGAILNNGQIWLTHVKLASNSAGGDGGGLFSTGPALLRSVEVFGNNANLLTAAVAACIAPGGSPFTKVWYRTTMPPRDMVSAVSVADSWTYATPRYSEMGRRQLAGAAPGAAFILLEWIKLASATPLSRIIAPHSAGVYTPVAWQAA